jgi:hypothetical protein
VLHHYQAGTIAARLKRWVRVRKSRIKGERKGVCSIVVVVFFH